MKFKCSPIVSFLLLALGVSKVEGSEQVSVSSSMDEMETAEAKTNEILDRMVNEFKLPVNEIFGGIDHQESSLNQRRLASPFPVPNFTCPGIVPSFLNITGTGTDDGNETTFDNIVQQWNAQFNPPGVPGVGCPSCTDFLRLKIFENDEWIQIAFDAGVVTGSGTMIVFGVVKYWAFLLIFEMFDGQVPGNIGPDMVKLTFLVQHIVAPHPGDDPFGAPIGDTLKITSTTFPGNPGRKVDTGRDICSGHKRKPTPGYPERWHKDCLVESELEVRVEFTFPPGFIDKHGGVIKVHHYRFLPEGFIALAHGDPHFQLWNGQTYDYHGGCDLVLINNPSFANGLGLYIHIRTKVRYEYSFIESAAVKIGDDILEFSSYGQFTLNGVEGATMPYKMADVFSTNYTNFNKKRHGIVISTGNDGEGIILTSFKDIVNVQIDNGGSKFVGSLGLMGDYLSGDMLGRDGKTKIEEPNAFGQEWQVQDTDPHLFQALVEPQYPQKCVVPDASAKASRRLGEGIPRKAAEEACAAHHDNPQMQEHCIFDVMATGDIEYAQNKPSF